jgi:hypothetical protein
MPKGPKGQKRPADVIGNATKLARIATGEETEAADDGKDAAAVSLGRKGGKARAQALTKKERAEIAKKAAWLVGKREDIGDVANLLWYRPIASPACSRLPN